MSVFIGGLIEELFLNIEQWGACQALLGDGVLLLMSTNYIKSMEYGF